MSRGEREETRLRSTDLVMVEKLCSASSDPHSKLLDRGRRSTCVALLDDEVDPRQLARLLLETLTTAPDTAWDGLHPLLHELGAIAPHRRRLASPARAGRLPRQPRPCACKSTGCSCSSRCEGEVNRAGGRSSRVSALSILRVSPDSADHLRHA